MKPLLLCLLTAAYYVNAGPSLTTTENAQTESMSEGQLISRARAIQTTMEMLEQRRHPKPKGPLGNDIGMARVLDPSRQKTRATEHANATTPDQVATTTTPPFTLDPETIAIARELHSIMDNVPPLPGLPIPQIPFRKDPEEEAIDQRITEVARQLAETSLWNDYRKSKIPHVFPVPSEHRATKEPHLAKAGKSLIVANTLPLVSYMQQENAHLQLIGETQQVPHVMVHEGFYPVTPAPELVGPLLGGPPLPTAAARRTPKNIGTGSVVQMPLSSYLRMMTSGLGPNELIVSVPTALKYNPAFIPNDGELNTPKP